MIQPLIEALQKIFFGVTRREFQERKETRSPVISRKRDLSASESDLITPRPDDIDEPPNQREAQRHADTARFKPSSSELKKENAMNMTLLPKFDYLKREDMPRMIREAMALYGVEEFFGAKDNPVIMAWAKEVGGDVAWFPNDQTPWCGLFMAVVAKRAGKDVPRMSLRAKAWLEFGQRSPKPAIGDVLVFNRGSNPAFGHVGLYVGETDHYFYVLGGNQSDAVCITRIAKHRLKEARLQYNIGRPKTAVPHIIGEDFGAVSRNEA